ncbi:MAG TPA: phytanoyl-CoA dioxygenase family protein [Streptosporangiaceae bacterium]
MDQATREHHLEQIIERGYTVIEGALEPGQADALREDIHRLETQLHTPAGRNEFEGKHTLRVHNLLARGPDYHKLALHPSTLPLMDLLLGPGCLLSLVGSIDIGPGESAQPVHSDDQIYALPRPHRPVVCNTMWAITDFTEDNGATRVIPGSHLADHPPDYEATYDTQPVEVGKGGVVVWNGSLWHGGGANRTSERRVAISVLYCAGFLRQEENQMLGVAPDLVRRFPHRLQELVGYGVYMGVLGHVDRVSPARLLAEDTLPRDAGRHPGAEWDFRWGSSPSV